MIGRWQRIINILAQLLEVPSGLIMKTEAPQHFIFINSKGAKNPYKKGGVFQLNTGLYCDSVIDKRSLLVVDDATLYAQWQNNPDMKHDMLFYMGLPLVWPDGDIFGTICVLDTKTNPQALEYKNLLEEFGGVVNADLKFLTELATRKSVQKELLDAQNHLEKRVEKRTKQLSDTNTALKVLLEHVESSRETVEERIFNEINTQIIPYLEKLKRHIKNDTALAFVDILHANATEITAPLNKHFATVFAKLTPTEIEIAKLIIQANSTKMIAEILNIATSTVDFHRHNIRKKVGINNSQMNLRSFLNSLT